MARTSGTVAGAALGALLAATGFLAASAPRAPLFGDGVWTTPVVAIAGGVGLAAALGAVLVVRAWPRGPGCDPGTARQRWTTVVLATVVVAAVVWIRGDRDPLEPIVGNGLDLGSLGGVATDGLEPLATTPTAVAGGLVFFAAVAVLLLLVVRSRRRPAAPPTSAAAATTIRAASDDLAGSPDEVVLRAWALAREAVVTWSGAGEQDPPRRLVRRVAGSAVAGPLSRLTEVYLPVRYGRAVASETDAAAARSALADVLVRTASLPGPARHR